MSKNNKYLRNLQALEEEKNLRSLPASNMAGLVNLSSNDYLGLNDDNDLQNDFRKSEIFDRLSFSAASTRLLTGNINQYSAVESTLTQLYDREASLVFNSGYHANMGILPAIADKKDLIIADKEVHASLIDAMKLSASETRRYRHMDLDHLETILTTHRDQYENVFIATESIFSMDGLRTDLPRLLEIKRKYDAYIYLDEAHAFGVCGEKGLGLAEEMGFVQEIDFIIGTFGKSLAGIGAFIICDDLFKKYLVNKSRSLIYTTGLPPVNLAWTHFLLGKLHGMSGKRNHLKETWNYFAQNLGLKAESHIVPYVLGNNHDVIGFAKYMQHNGFYVLPIRYPTIPKGTERIRFSFNTTLSKEMIEPIFEVFYKYKKHVE